MQVYTTETEQVDAIKRFFSTNGKYLAVGLVLGIGVLLGWRYWQTHQTNQLHNTAAVFEDLNKSLASGSKENVVAVEKFANETDNVYGVMADLELAKQAVAQNDLAQAEKNLLAASGKAKDENMQAVSNLRLARVQLAEDKTDVALKTLDLVKGKGWQVMVEDIRGDILAKKGDIAGARAAYSTGLGLDGPQVIKDFMKIKLNNLSN
ncbi:YfgM family protein [Xenorhabdus griffiniae]|uniref:Ancillary SecYEG translocon subunit n=1 Tax=Xenorhabdus griffiniae TaxID=351672 RepID=A0ABY9XL43_9GAMM|nr:YfgM family protein [Xenorhabdus griffiniae]MBD1228025.1 tetratricopeptide repeat protein [Xenorhabdus griffiniae]MBE8587736.1 tetratricopeptide repeat protein [Xenorhabdus griffiniae]WMV73668.1 YfgM family protein [Xenorhabdus griffiniae]WNH03348.1 YfgM family protein [Xenorhabdus griffiniae]